MKLDRRQLFRGAAALAAAGLNPGLRAPLLAASAPRLPADPASFPWRETETFINSAAYHPISVDSARAMESYMAYRLRGPGEGRREYGFEDQDALKAMFARLVNATPSEIAFVQSTSDGESIVVAGMDLPRSGGNVVIDQLHYDGSLYSYKRLEREGLEVRVVPHRDWVIDLGDMERAIDRKTRLVSMALVSNVNGYLHDVKAVSEIAHAHGAYVYADAVQAVGAVPLDVRAMGLDMFATSSYKWLMGDRGFGFLYVREDLQGEVVKPTRLGHRQYSRFDRNDLSWTARGGAYQYESGNIPNVLVACVSESLRYILELGVDRIRAHAKPLTDKLQKELPSMGYASITPKDTSTPIVTFLLKDPEATAKRLERANVAVTLLARYQRMRISPSVFNNEEDIDRLLNALA